MPYVCEFDISAFYRLVFLILLFRCRQFGVGLYKCTLGSFNVQLSFDYQDDDDGHVHLYPFLNPRTEWNT